MAGKGLSVLGDCVKQRGGVAVIILKSMVCMYLKWDLMQNPVEAGQEPARQDVLFETCKSKGFKSGRIYNAEKIPFFFSLLNGRFHCIAVYIK